MWELQDIDNSILLKLFVVEFQLEPWSLSYVWCYCSSVGCCFNFFIIYIFAQNTDCK